MARSALTALVPDFDGVAFVPAAANALGHSFNGRGAALYVKNGGGSSINVTLQTPGTVEELAVPDRVIAVAAGAEVLIAPTSAVEDATGNVLVDFSAVTSVTCLLLKTA